MRIFVLIAALATVVGAAVAVHADTVSFSRDIAPILLRRCTGCHGERSNLGGYRAHTYQGFMRSGASGKPAIVPGKPKSSHLLALLTAKSPDVRMPRSDDALSAQQIGAFRTWIAEGAKFDGRDVSQPLKSLLGPRTHPPAPAVYRAAVPIMALAIVPGGHEVVVGGYNELTVWSCETGKLVRRIPNLPQRIQALSFSADRRTLLVAGGTPGEYGEIALVDFSEGRRIAVVDSWNDICLAAAYSANGKVIVAGGADNSVRAYSSETRKPLWTSGVHSDWVTAVSCSADGQFVASASRDMTVKVNDLATGRLFATYSGHNRQIGQFAEHAPVFAVRFAPHGPTAYSAGSGRWVQVWDPVKAKAESGDAGDMEDRFSKQSHALHIPTGLTQAVLALVVRDDWIFAASADGRIQQFDTHSTQLIRPYRADAEWLFSLDLDQDAHRLVAGSYAGTVTVFDTTSGETIRKFRAQPTVGTVTAKR